jgi:glucosamine 6-phosphate synthetase-like amidotransferase/phosphosugar isomerase protein
LAAVRKTVAELQGAYALAVLSKADPECIVMAREGCPAVIGLGLDENFAASDVAALRNAKQARYLATLSICNVAESSMVRESNLVLLTRAGPEIGVASTKAFSTQLTALTMLTIALAKNGPAAAQEKALVSQLTQLPGIIEKTLKLDATIRALAELFVEKHHALFLGRGPLQAIAMQLLAYHVAVLKGTDVDQPRNLAKSLTVE